jgi:hypothetical protein
LRGAAWGASGEEDPVGGLQLLAILGVEVLLVLLAGLVFEGYTAPPPEATRPGLNERAAKGPKRRTLNRRHRPERGPPCNVART